MRQLEMSLEVNGEGPSCKGPVIPVGTGRVAVAIVAGGYLPYRPRA